MPAMTTMPKAIIRLWLMPAMTLGMANGRRIFVNICQGVSPLACPSSMNSLGVMRIPSEVSRMAGGMATMKVAMSAVAGPYPRSAIAGSR
ncbi:hypothetical protein D3C72_1609120 [compost metagenome]